MDRRDPFGSYPNEPDPDAGPDWMRAFERNEWLAVLVIVLAAVAAFVAGRLT